MSQCQGMQQAKIITELVQIISLTFSHKYKIIEAYSLGLGGIRRTEQVRHVCLECVQSGKWFLLTLYKTFLFPVPGGWGKGAVILSLVCPHSAEDIAGLYFVEFFCPRPSL